METEYRSLTEGMQLLFYRGKGMHTSHVVRCLSGVDITLATLAHVKSPSFKWVLGDDSKSKPSVQRRSVLWCFILLSKRTLCVLFILHGILSWLVGSVVLVLRREHCEVLTFA